MSLISEGTLSVNKVEEVVILSPVRKCRTWPSPLTSEGDGHSTLSINKVGKVVILSLVTTLRKWPLINIH